MAVERDGDSEVLPLWRLGRGVGDDGAGDGPSDRAAHTLWLLVPGYEVTRHLPLRKGNSYVVGMRWLGSWYGGPQTSYGWSATMNGLPPIAATYEDYPSPPSGARPGGRCSAAAAGLSTTRMG